MLCVGGVCVDPSKSSRIFPASNHTVSARRQLPFPHRSLLGLGRKSRDGESSLLGTCDLNIIPRGQFLEVGYSRTGGVRREVFDLPTFCIGMYMCLWENDQTSP